VRAAERPPLFKHNNRRRRKMIELRRPVLIKVIMTEAFRKQMIQEAAESAGRIDEMLKSLDSQHAALHADDAERAVAMLDHIKAEQERLTRFKGEIAWKVREIEGVQEGTELPFRFLDGTVTIGVGDDFLKKISQAEIILKDWQVVEIKS
jgi:hypothetical protein